jgi:colicin import membrane protein
MTTAEVAPDTAPKKAKLTAEEKAANKAAADKAKADKKAAAEAAKAAPKAKDTKNGVSRPQTGVTKLVWETADSLSSKGPTERAPLVEALAGKVEVGTIHTQYGRWRKYYGLTETKEQRQSRLATARADKDAKKAADKKVKDEAKAKKAADKAAADKVKADQAAADKVKADQAAAAEAAKAAAAPAQAEAASEQVQPEQAAE